MPKCDHVCKECGGHENGSWLSPTDKKLAEKQLCFNCDHWLSLVAAPEGPIAHRLARIDHIHYQICPGQTDKFGFQGFAGREFCIRFFDGRVVTTHNLWCQGRIPERFWDRLPDNAEFITTERRAEEAAATPQVG